MSATSQNLMRVGQLANRTGKTVRALHFYEELGLLAPTRRSKGGFRMYDETALIRVRWIDRLQELGFSLPDIREFLESLRSESNGPAAMDSLRRFYAEKFIETQAHIARLQSLEKELQSSLAYLHVCQTCAVETPRSACGTCEEPLHEGVSLPEMVAAIQDPS